MLILSDTNPFLETVNDGVVGGGYGPLGGYGVVTLVSASGEYFRIWASCQLLRCSLEGSGLGSREGQSNISIMISNWMEIRTIGCSVRLQ